MSSQGVSLDKELLPHKFNATDIPKFKATDNPYFHLRAFETIMSIKGIDKKVFPSLFSLSLETVCQQWFFSLEKEKTSTWESILNAFVDRYKCNIQVVKFSSRKRTKASPLSLTNGEKPQLR